MDNQVIEGIKRINEETMALREELGDVSDELCTLDIGQTESGFYLSTQQVDLLLLVNASTPDELREFISNCVQIKHLDFGEINEDNLEEKKKEVFDQYKASYIDFRELVERKGFTKSASKIRRVHHSLERNMPKELVPGALETLSLEGELGLVKFINNSNLPNKEEVLSDMCRFISIDYENIQGISYDEIVALDDLIKRDPSISTIISIGPKYDMAMHYTLDGTKKFDSYFIDRALQYAMATKKHIRYHSLFDRSTAMDFKEEGYSREEVLEALRSFSDSYLSYLRDHDEVLEDNSRVINCAEIFNELLGYKCEEYGVANTDMVWDKMFGITIDDLMGMVKGRIPDGVEVMYNETALEEGEPRLAAVDRIIQQIYDIDPSFINIFGNQLHVYDSLFSGSNEYSKMQASAAFLSNVSTKYGIRPQITEHDLNINADLIENCNKYGVSKEYMLLLKRHYQKMLSNTLQEYNVPVESVDYWSLFDKVDHNYVRSIGSRIREGRDYSHIDSQSACLIPEHSDVSKTQSLNPNGKQKEKGVVPVLKPEYKPTETGSASIVVVMAVMLLALLAMLVLCFMVM